MSRAPKLDQFDTLGEEIDVPLRPAFWSESRSWNPENPISDGGGSCVVFIIAMSGGIAARTIRGGRIDETRERGSDLLLVHLALK